MVRILFRDIYFPFRGGNNIIFKPWGKKYDERGKNMMKGKKDKNGKKGGKGE